MTPARIIGIDPGSRLTGVAIIEAHRNQYQPLFFGAINTGGGALAARIKIIYDDISQVVAEFKPHSCAIEQVFVGKSVSSALKLGHARGAAMCALAHLPISEYAPRLIKQAVTGSGSADKTQVQHMVIHLLNLKMNHLQADAADALAVAICHANLQNRNAVLLRR